MANLPGNNDGRPEAGPVQSFDNAQTAQQAANFRAQQAANKAGAIANKAASAPQNNAVIQSTFNGYVSKPMRRGK